MSYLPLARKYRPKNFDQLAGHTGIRKVLVNALEQNRLHHTYLLTGTRGVGKTSLARLLAKCLNCETRVTSKPCEQCSNCVALQKNQFVDLIEFNAASNTGIDDIKNLLDNVQYKPALGRYKIYLLDEVHGLSKHSRDALLKTLEEPPPHVIFILASTEPQKLYETILSRAFHLPLQHLGATEITKQLEKILTQESIQYDLEVLQNVAELAKGSMRDALSLIEPLILYDTGKTITLEGYQALFGNFRGSDYRQLIQALNDHNLAVLAKFFDAMSKRSVDFTKVCNDLLELLYQLAQIQHLPGLVSPDSLRLKETIALAEKTPPEKVQLYYEILLKGKQHLHLAPNPELGLKMIVLRMLAFQPEISAVPAKNESLFTPAATFDTQKKPTPISWNEMVDELSLAGFSKSLALNCTLESYEADSIVLMIDEKHKVLQTPEREEMLKKALATYFKQDIKLTIKAALDVKNTPANAAQQKRIKQEQKIQQSMMNDPAIKAIQETFDVVVKPGNIKLTENTK